jgi:Ca-activated chloride channel family protein
MQYLKYLTLLVFLSLTACHHNTDYRSAEMAYAQEPMTTGDQYEDYGENPFVDAATEPVSTFSIDADGAAYANVRRFLLQDRQLPPPGAVRIEEMINYFPLEYPHTDREHPISVNSEVATCPWNPGHQLLRIGLQGQPLPQGKQPPTNFVFLIDVSGSMSSEDKLELLKTGFKLLVDQMTAADRIAIVTYAGNAGVLLPATSGAEKDKIKKRIDRLGAGGSTAGAEGILTAYAIAQENFVHGGNNRVIVGTDGDFNVGPSSQEEILELIKKKRDEGVYLTVLGVGRGNLNDAMLEQLANQGNGTYEYIDGLAQLKKVFLYERSKFYTVAKDVKIQLAFEPDYVEAYRLIGYENRVMSNEAFTDDREDAGEIGAGQSITALYELIPKATVGTANQPLATISYRYKAPNSDTSVPLEHQVQKQSTDFFAASDYLRFTASVACFGMLLTNSEYHGEATYEDVRKWLTDVRLPDEHGFVEELEALVQIAKGL